MIGLWFDAHGLSKECIVTVNATQIPERSSCNAIINNYKSNKNSYLITVQSDKYRTTKSIFCVKWLPWKTHFEPLYVQWTLPLCNKQWPANSYKTYDLYRFQRNKTRGSSNTFLNNLMICVCILCEEGFQESSAINEKIQQHNSGLITHRTKSSV